MNDRVIIPSRLQAIPAYRVSQHGVNAFVYLRPTEWDERRSTIDLKLIVNAGFVVYNTISLKEHVVTHKVDESPSKCSTMVQCQ